MSENDTNNYDVDRHIAEIYDQTETQTDDVALLRRLIGTRGPLRILEPFCGDGRIAIPLAMDGHELVGIDQSGFMLERAREKIAGATPEVRARIALVHGDVVASRWPEGFDVVLLAANCFYELASPEEQEGCVASAVGALEPGGHVYVDNNHMEGDLDASWRVPGVNPSRFPSGACADGTRLDATTETIWWDAPRRLVRFRRTLAVTRPDGSVTTQEWVQQEHPPSTGEVRSWLEKHGFVIEQLYGDRAGNPYTDASGRAIFWAKRKEV